MQYVNSAERLGIRKGMQQGLLQGIMKNSKESVVDILSLRFGEASKAISKKIEEISDIPLLKALHKKAVTEPSMGAFETAFYSAIERHLESKPQ